MPWRICRAAIRTSDCSDTSGRKSHDPGANPAHGVPFGNGVMGQFIDAQGCACEWDLFRLSGTGGIEPFDCPIEKPGSDLGDAIDEFAGGVVVSSG